MPVVKATTNEVPIGARAVLFNFKTDQGACSATFDRYSTDFELFNNLPQMTSNAIASVINTGRKIEDYTTWFVS